MTEEQPPKGHEHMEPTKVPLSGPNVASTFDLPPSPDAVKAHDAAKARRRRRLRYWIRPSAAVTSASFRRNW